MFAFLYAIDHFFRSVNNFFIYNTRSVMMVSGSSMKLYFTGGLCHLCVDFSHVRLLFVESFDSSFGMLVHQQSIFLRHNIAFMSWHRCILDPFYFVTL